MRHKEAINYICHKLESELPVPYPYHNIKHTLDVLGACDRLALMEGLDAHETRLLESAAAYHDAGFLDTYDGHEERSVEIIQQVLPDFGYLPQDIDIISCLILSTMLPQKAFDKLSMLLCDADLDYLGRPDFDEISNTLRDEWQVIGRTYTDKEWFSLQVDFLKHHKYYCVSAQNLRNQGLQENLHRMEMRLKSFLAI